jgi:hypothetical protein
MQTYHQFMVPYDLGAIKISVPVPQSGIKSLHSQLEKLSFNACQEYYACNAAGLDIQSVQTEVL